MAQTPCLSFPMVLDPNNAEQVRDLLENSNGASVGLEQKWKQRGETLLHAAVKSNVPETVAAFLELGGAVLLSTPNIFGETPLHTALKLRYTGSAVARHVEIVKMLLAKRAVDLNAFSEPKWIKEARGTSTSKFKWRLNVLRFAIAHNQSDTILHLLEANGAVIGYDPCGTDQPLSYKEAPSRIASDRRITPSAIPRRLPYFLGLVAMDEIGDGVERQSLMLRRYPQHIRRLGAPTSDQLYGIMGFHPAPQVLERVIGNEVIASPLSGNGIPNLPFVITVMISTSGIVPGTNIGFHLRQHQNDPGVQDAFFLWHRLSTHQSCGKHDYRRTPPRWGGGPNLTLGELQAPVLFEAADLV